MVSDGGPMAIYPTHRYLDELWVVVRLKLFAASDQGGGSCGVFGTCGRVVRIDDMWMLPDCARAGI
jgi:hypothetical protein